MAQNKLKSSKILGIIVLTFVLGLISGWILFLEFSTLKEILLYRVEEVVDGDTIKVNNGSGTATIRLLGINTPEVKSSYSEEECFGQEASQELKNFLLGRVVHLIPDPKASDKDKYGRLLRYVFLTDGTFVNGFLVKRGLAFNYIYGNEVLEFTPHFADLEAKAKEERVGLWGEGCDYAK